MLNLINRVSLLWEGGAPAKQYDAKSTSQPPKSSILTPKSTDLLRIVVEMDFRTSKIINFDSKIHRFATYSGRNRLSDLQNRQFWLQKAPICNV